jgi:hypothetical protein
LRLNKIPVILEDSDTVKSTFKDAAKKLTGNRQRDFMAKVTEDYREGGREAPLFQGWGGTTARPPSLVIRH